MFLWFTVLTVKVSDLDERIPQNNRFFFIQIPLFSVNFFKSLILHVRALFLYQTHLVFLKLF